MAFEITIPRLGWSMEEGVFARWLKLDGETIRQGDPLFELEGEKAIQEIEAVDTGILRIPANGPQPGSVVKVGAIVGYLVAVGEASPEVPMSASLENDQQITEPLEGASHVSVITGSRDAVMAPAAAPSVRRMAREVGVELNQVEGTGRGGRILADDIMRASSNPRRDKRASAASPRARRAASEFGIDWTQLSGTGAGGRIREQDVLAALTAKKSQSSHLAAGGKRVPLTSRRRVIAKRMVASRQQTVPVTLTTKADAENLVNLREQFKSSGGMAIIPGFQDIIIKLVAGMLLRHPLLSGRWDEDAIVLPAANELHLGMAVDTADGLLVPVLRSVAQLSLVELATRSRLLAEQARSGKLAAADMQGAVFTITNLGAFGIDTFTPIINSPEAAILGLGAIRREPIVLDDGTFVARHQITLSLTFDHRILDGAPAARFLQDMAKAIANPSAALLR
ncbi:MAG: 2-oxo acid dehydrogenase subunit E2 [Planctomycetota bacterium]|nr:2-oxo acid dehydrogenase subunit E2 [Planctomycetota bacterium]